MTRHGGCFRKCHFSQLISISHNINILDIAVKFNRKNRLENTC